MNKHSKKENDDEQFCIPLFDIKSNPILFASPDVDELEKGYIINTINTGWLTNGSVVSKFEKKVAEASGCKRSVAFDSCTAAMEMSLRLLGIGQGDEVITTPYTYTATAEVIRNVGATIVFADLATDSFEMDYEKVVQAITPRTKAIIPVDIGGKLCNYGEIKARLLCKRNLFTPSNELQESIGRVAIISDSAHSFGAKMDGHICGEFADFTCFSFHVLKSITTGGEGGAVVWNDIQNADNDSIEQTFRLLGDHGQTTRTKDKNWEYDIKMFGYNSIMTNIDAAMGVGQLERLHEITKKRLNVTRIYDELFENSHVTPLITHIGDDYLSGMHLYPVKVTDNDQEKRNRIYSYLTDKGIPTNVHYKPLPMMTAYKNIGFDINDYPNAYKRFSSLLTIPYHTRLTAEQQRYIVSTIEKAVEKA